MTDIILASRSDIRQNLLRGAQVPFQPAAADIDERRLTAKLLANGAVSDDIALALADSKAKEVNKSFPEALIIGCDQILEAGGQLLSKPTTSSDARAQLSLLRNSTHRLFSAIVLWQGGSRIWHHIGRVTLSMRDFSDAYLDEYLDRNWPKISGSVGGYMLEAEGSRLFSRIDGDFFHVLGMPLIELLSELTQKGVIKG